MTVATRCPCDARPRSPLSHLPHDLVSRAPASPRFPWGPRPSCCSSRPIIGELKQNRAFSQTFGIPAEEAENRLLSNVGSSEWDHPDLRRLLVEVVPQSARLERFEFVQSFPKLGRKRVVFNASRIEQPGRRPHLILLCFCEVHDA